MRLVITTGLGVDRPEDYAALKQYLMANLPGKPTELVTANPQSCDTLVNQLAAEFNIPVVRRVIEWTENTVAPAKLMVGDMITYASEKPGSAMVVVCHKPSELMLHARTVCQTYELPIHLVRVPPTRYDNGTDQQVAAARDVTAVSTVTRAPQQQNEPYIFPQSFSSLQVFDTCPRQYEAKYITKDVPYVQSPAAKRGDDVHHALEGYLKSGGMTRLPADMAAYTKYADWVLDRADKGGGTVLAERMLAVDADLNPVAYKSRSRWMGGKIDVSIVYPTLVEVFDWKGLALNTPLPSPRGWTTMADVAVGDALYARNGAVCRVVGKSRVKNIHCFQVDFDDRSSVVCDEEHLWVLTDGRVVPVTSLTTKDKIPLAHPVVGEGAMVLDPYVLGVWLADGKHTSSEVSKPLDNAVWAEMERRGFAFGTNTGKGCATRTVLGVRGKLSQLGVLGRKHIPAAYLRASVPDRIDLLRGIMDGDGYANPKRKQAVLQMTNESLVRQVMELALSLGERATMRRVQGHGFGKPVTSWQLAWRPVRFNPFADPKKAAVIDACAGESVDSVGRTWKARDYRRVVAVTKVSTVPTQCIAVDSEDNTFLCTKNWIPTHNTGKVKNNPTQLQMYGGLSLAEHKDIQTVAAGYIWLEAETISPPVFYARAQYANHWDTFQHKYAALRQAYINGVFPPTPNGLCRQWCDVTRCEYHGRGR